MERQRAAEIAALEWKLRETRRRHADELACLGVVGCHASTGCVAGLTDGSAITVDAWRPQHPVGGTAPHLPAAALQPFCQRVGGGVGSRGTAGVPTATAAGLGGPTLVSKRRVINHCPYRLWVEDLGSANGARVHAMDEESGARTHADVPDALLSVMLATFQRSRGVPEAATGWVDVAGEDATADDGVDEFLAALLGAACVVTAATSDALELRLPAQIPVPQGARAVQPPPQPPRQQPPQQVHRESSAQGASKASWLFFQPCGSNNSVGWVASSFQECCDAAESCAALPRGAAAAAARRISHGSRQVQSLATQPREYDGVGRDRQREQSDAPRLQRRGPDGGGGGGSWGGGGGGGCSCIVDNLLWPVPESRAKETQRAFANGAYFEVRPPSNRAGAGPSSGSGRPPCSASISSCLKQSSRRALVRPQSAPHDGACQGKGGDASISCRNVAHGAGGDNCAVRNLADSRPAVRLSGCPRPQSARQAGRTGGAEVTRAATGTASCQTWPPTPGAVVSAGTRRARPSSAKALKHRRVVDDGVDSIIYEDIEGEEDMSEPWEHVSVSVSDAAVTSSVEERSARTRGSTGGCSSCSSSIRGSISSRSVSRSRRPASAGAATASSRRGGGGGGTDRSNSAQRASMDARQARSASHRASSRPADVAHEHGPAHEAAAAGVTATSATVPKTPCSEEDPATVTEGHALASTLASDTSTTTSNTRQGVGMKGAEKVRVEPPTMLRFASCVPGSGPGDILIPRPPAERRPSGATRPAPLIRMAAASVDLVSHTPSPAQPPELLRHPVAVGGALSFGPSALGPGPRASSPPPRRAAVSGENPAAPAVAGEESRGQGHLLGW